ncbi:unnamed protein product [Mytilus edulis]|uniref:G-protein coupled receptors family 1 profile domain-containing protein n=1 Tax=Mytilus edulis TaxID=6550 RepID=A0A8S3RTP1_MYTED|nr:unnamed protein product [Mytilus edulis]
MRHNTEANQTAQLLDMINTTMNLSSNVSSEMGLHVLPDLKGYLVIVNGYVVPILAIVVLIANVIVILVLRRQQTYGASQAGLDVVNKKMRLHNKSESSISAVKENTRVTIMIVFMAAVTLLVELPSGIILSFYVSPYITNVEVFDVNTLNSMQIIANLVIIFHIDKLFFLAIECGNSSKRYMNSVSDVVIQGRRMET